MYILLDLKIAYLFYLEDLDGFGLFIFRQIELIFADLADYKCFIFRQINKNYIDLADYRLSDNLNFNQWKKL